MTPPSAAAARSSVSPSPRVRRAPVRHPRRVSGPARPRPAQAPARRQSAVQSPGIALRAVGAINSASQSPLLDRLIRSRLWIGVLAFSLIGIVAMQLLVLKLNTDVGHLLARAATLQRQNTLTRIEDSRTSSGALVEPTAAAAGMTMAAPGSLRFLTASRSDLARAAAVLAAPLAATSEASTSGVQASAGGGEVSTGGAGEPSRSGGEVPTGGASEASTGGGEASPPIEAPRG